MGEFFRVVPKLIQPREVPSRWRLTYAFELQTFTPFGTGGLGANRIVNLPLNPTRYDVRAKAAANIDFTVGGASVDEGGFITRDLSVEGTCGLAPKRGWSPGTKTKPGGLIYADGNTLWRELRNLFRLYGHFQKTSTELRYRMVWHDFRNDDHWVVIPTEWAMSRNASEHRLHYPYRIEMTAVADADASDLPLAAQIFGAARDVVAEGLSYINVAAGYAQDAAAFTQEASATAAAAVAAAQGALNSFVTAGAGIRQGVQDAINVPKSAVLAMRNTVAAWEANVWGRLNTEQVAWNPGDDAGSSILEEVEVAIEAQAAMDGVLARPLLFSPSWRDFTADEANLNLGEALLSDDELAAGDTKRGLARRATPGASSRRDAAIPRERTQLDLSRRYTGTRPYVVKLADTVHTIASREMGHPGAWWDIVRVNRLAAPYINVAGLPGGARPGDTLMLPIVAGGGADDVRSDGPLLGQRPEEQILGVDLYLDASGEWEVDPASDGGDLRVVRGLPNFEQALGRIQFHTVLGTNLVFPQLGILAPVGEPNAAAIPEAIALSVRRVVLREPRTAEMTDIRLADTGSGAVVEVDVTPKGVRGGFVVRRAVE